MFKAGPIKFDHQIPFDFRRDVHVIVAAIGERSRLGPVMGPEHGNDRPVAVSNPISVDVDDGGFQPKGDPLGQLPVKEQPWAGRPRCNSNTATRSRAAQGAVIPRSAASPSSLTAASGRPRRIDSTTAFASPSPPSRSQPDGGLASTAPLPASGPGPGPGSASG